MLDVWQLRQQFPALQHTREGRNPIFLDGAAGTQVPQRTILAMVRYLSTCNANHGGVFASSVESDHILHKAHEWTAAFLNAPAPDEVVFGPNMTTLTFQLSRSLARTWQSGDEVLTTWLEHDANVSPWELAARDAGATVRKVEIHREDCTLDMEDLKKQLNGRTRLVAVTCASNLVGTLPDVAAITRLAHDAGALVFLDAVHYAPHGPIDVRRWGCDFLACSAYKFFGPHVGVLWGRREHLERLPAYKLRPAPEELPGRWMTGTQNHEGLAGLTGTLDYLADLGKQHLLDAAAVGPVSLPRLQLLSAMTAVRAHETDLMRHLLRGLAQRPAWKIWGIASADRLAERVPTVALTHPTYAPIELARHLAKQQIYSWHGNLYALGLTERLGLEAKGGVLRVGLAHYNTLSEVDALLAALDEIA